MCNRFLGAVTTALTVFLVSDAVAFEATITRTSPLKAHPAGIVARNELAPVEGVPVAPARSPAEPYVSDPAFAVPIPTFNPSAVSFCESDIL
jgi:hypothetical protein